MNIFEDDFNNTSIVSQADRLFAKPPTHDFITPKLDLDINPDNFVKWLMLEHDDIKPHHTYAQAVGSMCEFSCLYLAMKFRLSPQENNLKIICGNYGFWEHFWMEYSYEGKVYILDLTLQQFIPTAPKLAITERKYEGNGYRVCDEFCDYGQTIKGYCDEKRAFMFYPHPKKVEI